MTLMLTLFALTPAIDAFACDADDTLPVSASALTTQTPSETTRESSQHRCYCAGHCCPAGMAMHVDLQVASLAVTAGARTVIKAEVVVSQTPTALDRPPRA